MEPIVDTGRSNNRRAAAGVIVLLLLLLLIPVGKKVFIDHDPKPPTPPGAPAPKTECGSESGFLAMFATGHRFGPPVTTTEVDKAQAQLHKERCLDSAKTVAHDEYRKRTYSSPEERALKTVQLRDNPKLRAQKVKELEAREATAVKVEITTMSNKYQTMYMVTEGHDVPWIYATTADRPTFRVLKFTYADGSWDAYKLDCDFQPVASKFKGLPNTPEAPPATPVTPHTPPTGGHSVCPPNSATPGAPVPESGVCPKVDQPVTAAPNGGGGPGRTPPGGNPGQPSGPVHGTTGCGNTACPRPPGATTTVPVTAPPTTSPPATTPPTTAPPTTTITAAR